MDIKGNQKFGQGYWVDRFKPADAIAAVAGIIGSGTSNREIITGVLDGVNKVFTLPDIPDPLNLELFWNGALQSEPSDYVLSGLTITFSIAPGATDIIVAYYGGRSKRQTVSGTINGANKIFTFASAPSATSLQYFWNGLLQFEGAGNDYTLSGSTLTMALAPGIGDTLVAYF